MNLIRSTLLPLALACWLAGCAANGTHDGNAGSGAAAATTAKADPATLARIRAQVEKRLGHAATDADPDADAAAAGEDALKVASVRPMPMLGLYEVVTTDHKLIYTDEKVDYVISGHIYDLNTMNDITGERLEQITAIPLDSLPLELAIKTVKGNGKRQMVVFSDTDCPFCRRFEGELDKVTDVTVYTFLYPIAQLHPDAPEHTRRIWCAPDRVKAWKDYWTADVVPASPACDTGALDRILKLGTQHHINGTPTLVFADGHVVPGAMPAEMIEKSLGPR